MTCDYFQPSNHGISTTEHGLARALTLLDVTGHRGADETKRRLNLYSTPYSRNLHLKECRNMSVLLT